MDLGIKTTDLSASAPPPPSGVQRIATENAPQSPGVRDSVPQIRTMAAGAAPSGMIATSHTSPQFIDRQESSTPYSALCTAARNGDAIAVRRMLAANGSAAGMIDPATGDSALILAVQHGHKDVAHLLFDAGANPAQRSHAGETAIDLAIVQGSFLAAAAMASMAATNAKVAFYALLNGPQQGPSQTTATTAATATTATTATTANTANTATTSNATTAVRSTSNVLNKPATTPCMPERTIRPPAKNAESQARDRGISGRGKVPVGERKKHETVPQSMATALSASSTPAASATLPLSLALFDAVQRRDTLALKRLLAKMKKSGGNMQMELHRACPVGTVGPASSNKVGLTLLALAAFLDHDDLFALLINAGVKINRPDAKGMTALMWAARGGKFTAVQALLHAGASLHRADATGASALMHATRCGHTMAALVLMQDKAPVNQIDLAGATALLHAAEHGHATIVQSMLHYGADINQANAKGVTALMYAARYGHGHIVQILLDHGARIDQAGVNGETALMCAVLGCHTQVLRTLLLAGANVTLETRRNGKTAMHMAVKKEAIECITLLRQAGAE